MPSTKDKPDPAVDLVLELLRAATELAREYYELTDRPLGITGEVAEFEAVRLVPGLELAPPRQQGYDATRIRAGRTERIQIKGRRFSEEDGKKTQRTGVINVNHEWNVLMLVLLNERFETVEIHEIPRELVVTEIQRPGSKARARGQLPVAWLKKNGQQTWPKRGAGSSARPAGPSEAPDQ